MVEGNEDCLLLDIFTPKLGYDTPLPVVVYVGGSSMGGDTHRSVRVALDRYYNNNIFIIIDCGIALKKVPPTPGSKV